MTSALDTEEHARSRTAGRVGRALLLGGALWFAGGALHPKEDPPGVSLEEHLLVMYENGNWYPSHALLLVGIGLIAAALVALVRSGALAHVPRARMTATIGAWAAVFGTAAAFLHLVMAVDADRIAAHQSTPLTDIQLVLEAIAAPAVGLAVAVLAVVGAATRALGNRTAAVFGVVGGTAYALAGGTVLFTDALNALFPIAGLIGVWAVLAGASLVRRAKASPAVPLVASTP